MKIVKEQIHPLIKMVNPNLKLESILVFNQKERTILDEAYKILDKASDLWEKNHPGIESYHNQYFLASIELEYVIDNKI